MALFKARKPSGEPGEWFYCVKHHKAEEGPECPSKNRLGPYPSKAAAEQAMTLVAERNQDWDARSGDGGGGATNQ